MSRRDKLIKKMRLTPGSVRFNEVEALLTYEGFILFNQRGSHCTYHRHDGKILTIVHPHGGDKACHKVDVQKLLEVLGL